ncbi:hypothetical protein, partial [Bacillus safensis]|uniref:hypothetical protein n=1 Tax=Bacillus safensis TaxID=561879 RepID=UPI002E1F847F|nr:hypothetical protein [Bacillus safensis]
MKIKSMIVSSLTALVVLFALMPIGKVHAEGTESMTIVSGKNTSFETAATPSGSLKDKVYGYYANGQFVVNGLVNEIISNSGQKITVFDPTGTGSTTLVVYTQKSEVTPPPTPKPEKPSEK